MKKTKAEYTKILADFLRSQTSDDQNLNDEETILNHGGDTLCEIIADFENGKYLSKSVDSSVGTIYTVIDSGDYKKSFSAESHETE